MTKIIIGFTVWAIGCNLLLGPIIGGIVFAASVFCPIILIEWNKARRNKALTKLLSGL